MIHFTIGTKAQFIKMAPVILEVEERGHPYRLVDLGQHGEFTPSLRQAFGVRVPDICLTERRENISTMRAGLSWLARGLLRQFSSPSALRARVFGEKGGVCVVHGDTASTLVGTVLARRAGLAVAHVEAGLRSFCWRDPFPEELIRIWCMRRANLLFAPTEEAAANLDKMHVRGQVFRTDGNTIVDALRHQLNSRTTSGEAAGSFVLATCHRLETLKRKRRLQAVVECLNAAAEECRIVFVLHEATRGALMRFRLLNQLDERIERRPMQPYFAFAALIRDAKCVFSDGGSIQEECAILGVPLFVLRANTERADGIGSSAILGGFNPDRARRFVRDADTMRTDCQLDVRNPSSQVAAELIDWDLSRTAVTST
jgi:UDP-N-acetylglucosamine 2-epimerase (non-hydrolysing)